MKLTELLLDELESEAEKSRRALECTPDGKHDWKPHDRSMIFGYLADMVATIPTWVAMIVTQDELDMAPKAVRSRSAEPEHAVREYAGLDKSTADAREALAGHR